MPKPVNMNPEDWAAEALRQQQERIEELEAQLAESGKQSKVLEYIFAAGTTEPPGSNQVRLDAGPPFATKIWAHRLTSNGEDATNFFTLYHEGDRAFVQDKNDANAYARYVLVGDPIDKSGYTEIPVAFLDAGNPLNGGQPALLAMIQQ